MTVTENKEEKGLELMSFRETPEARFLSKMLKALRHFKVFDNKALFARWPTERLVNGYKDEPETRAAFIGATTRMPAEYAGRLSVLECIQILEIARDVDKTDADTIFGFVTSDELVRVQDVAEIFDFIEKTKWDERDTPENRELAAVLLAEYKREELAGSAVECLRAIERAIGIRDIVRHLQRKDAELVELIVERAAALADETDDKDQPRPVAFGIEERARVMDTDLLAKHLPLPLLMRPIRAVAERAGWVKKPEPVVVPSPPPSTPSLPPADAPGDGDKKPTDPPAGSSDDEDAALEALLREQAIASASARTSGDLELDGDGNPIEPVSSGLGVPPPPPPGGKPPPLPRTTEASGGGPAFSGMGPPGLRRKPK